MVILINQHFKHSSLVESRGRSFILLQRRTFVFFIVGGLTLLSALYTGKKVKDIHIRNQELQNQNELLMALGAIGIIISSFGLVLVWVKGKNKEVEINNLKDTSVQVAKESELKDREIFRLKGLEKLNAKQKADLEAQLQTAKADISKIENSLTLERKQSTYYRNAYLLLDNISNQTKDFKDSESDSETISVQGLELPFLEGTSKEKEPEMVPRMSEAQRGPNSSRGV